MKRSPSAINTLFSQSCKITENYETADIQNYPPPIPSKTEIEKRVDNIVVICAKIKNLSGTFRSLIIFLNRKILFILELIHEG